MGTGMTLGCTSDPPCTLCCKTFRIEELNKPRMTWCQHCTKKACGIYHDRPQSCRDFRCLWLVTQEDSDEYPMRPELKPSVCGGVIHVTKDGKRLVVDMNDGKDWRKGALGEFIINVSEQLPVYVRIRDRLIF